MVLTDRHHGITQVTFKQANIYRLLHQLGLSWITTRSRHPKQSQDIQDAFKKLPAVNDP
ncbi:hypothetical protein Sfri_1556 [Shewanella frigidimarina NCIMB 400]|uniref:Winged helix-turn helix domain-containing protein n=1 Tax=Shewanella frigidimarina (strain NCIMB 400) TaxID=318167 RepID=Q084A8_SHEFN|nr:hypothetical protein Sfri_1556 [Shewanella frigidimarina NCIMB 400]